MLPPYMQAPQAQNPYTFDPFNPGHPEPPKDPYGYQDAGAPMWGQVQAGPSMPDMGSGMGGSSHAQSGGGGIGGLGGSFTGMGKDADKLFDPSGSSAMEDAQRTYGAGGAGY